MTREEQWDWVTSREQKSHYWADEEMEIRRLAAEIVDKIRTGNEVITVAVRRPSGDTKTALSYDTVQFQSRDIQYLGGLEGLLLVEEVLRRSNGL